MKGRGRSVMGATYRALRALASTGAGRGAQGPLSYPGRTKRSQSTIYACRGKRAPLDATRGAFGLLRDRSGRSILAGAKSMNVAVNPAVVPAGTAPAVAAPTAPAMVGAVPATAPPAPAVQAPAAAPQPAAPAPGAPAPGAPAAPAASGGAASAEAKPPEKPPFPPPAPVP